MSQVRCVIQVSQAVGNLKSSKSLLYEFYCRNQLDLKISLKEDTLNFNRRECFKLNASVVIPGEDANISTSTPLRSLKCATPTPHSETGDEFHKFKQSLTYSILIPTGQDMSRVRFYHS